MGKVLNLTYASSLRNLCEINSSFDTGILRIAYAGVNRNGSRIDKAVFEKCIKTIYNCPIVCNYNRENDTLGGHDIEVIKSNDGSLRMINVTTPIGIIPESSKVFWEEVEEDDGEKREYLCAEALLWKRQEAYKKIKEDGCVAQSMEITVKSGEMDEGIYRINDFEFTAFALIGVEPCFESAALEFSKQDFKEQLSQMMEEIKETFSKTVSSDEANINAKIRKEEIMLGENTITSTLDNLTIVTQAALNTDGVALDDIVYSQGAVAKKEESVSEEDAFALESNIKDEIERKLSEQTTQAEWGEYARYIFVDYDRDANVVYFVDTEDWLLYGCNYTANADAITIDFESAKRKKFEIVDFEGEEQAVVVPEIFKAMESSVKKYASDYNETSSKLESAEKELDMLREFKSEVESEKVRKEKEAVFEKFKELDGIEAFETLKTESDKYDAETLEEKCFAIKGRNSEFKFSSNSAGTTKLKVEKTAEDEEEPYGGIFKKFKVTAE